MKLQKDWSLSHFLYYITWIILGTIVLNFVIFFLMDFSLESETFVSLPIIDPLVKINPDDLFKPGFSNAESQYFAPMEIRARFMVHSVELKYIYQINVVRLMRVLRFALLFAFFFLFSRIFRSVVQKNPFDSKNSLRLYIMGTLLIGLTVLNGLHSHLIAKVLSALPGGPSLNFSSVLELDFLPFFGLVLLFLGYVYKKGNEMNESLRSYHNEMEVLVAERTKELEKSLEDLKNTQDQLIQQEKLASLGQLTAGIAHEIKNPLNFVNNFSELSVELIEEAREELSAVSSQLSAKGEREKVEEALEILNDIEANLRKIHEHGSRADSIVKSMLEHSRGGSGKREPTDLNALVKEFVNLSFHGMRAGKNPINVDMEFDLDESIGKVPLIAEDFSRVIVNLCNNAFDAMREKLSAVSDQPPASYKAKLTVRTKAENGKVMIEIEDNGPGIPEEMKDKILQPFFTTKKGTEGTGLGLSITHDIVKAHGGYLDIDSKAGEYSIFKIKIN